MIRPHIVQPPADPHEAATWWSARRRLGFTSPREEETFAAWLAADPHNGMAWEATEGPMEAISVYAALPELREMREAALAAGPPRRRVTGRWMVLGGAIAASLIFGLFLAWPPDLRVPGSAPVQTASSSVERYMTGVGERRTVRLTDGSTIDLNTASTLEVAYGPQQRDVRLLSGQAMFRVARDTGRPFVVAAGDRRIVATGTAFDVRLGERGTVTVLLVEGRVRVEPVRPSAGSTTPQVETLEPGQRLVTAANVAQVVTADVERDTSWTRGQLIFRDDRLSDAIAEVNRYSSARLVVNDPRVANLRVSGAFASGSTENFVAAITAFYPIEARREAPGVTVLAWRGEGG
jgi:transmembrane sensor